MEKLITDIDKIHTTDLGIKRIKRNLNLTTNDVVQWCKKQILNERAVIERRGKNWYVTINDCLITINASSYTIITAHKTTKKMSPL